MELSLINFRILDRQIQIVEERAMNLVEQLEKELTCTARFKLGTTHYDNIFLSVFPTNTMDGQPDYRICDQFTIEIDFNCKIKTVELNSRSCSPCSAEEVLFVARFLDNVEVILEQIKKVDSHIPLLGHVKKTV
jgi:hypothetical protein